MRYAGAFAIRMALSSPFFIRSSTTSAARQAFKAAQAIGAGTGAGPQSELGLALVRLGPLLGVASG